VDVARGFCLLIMTVDHLPRHILSRFSNVEFGPFGFFTGASGFVFLSGLCSAWVYGRVLRRQGAAATWRRTLRRAGLLYLTNMALFLLVFAGVLLRFLPQSHWRSEFPLFFSEPGKALLWGLLQFYRPGYLDILPMYVFFLLIVAPALSQIASRRTWVVVGLSTLTWFWTQVRPPAEVDALNPLSYQILFVFGLVIGATQDVKARLRSPTTIRLAQASLALTALLFLGRLEFAISHDFERTVPHWFRLMNLQNNGPGRLANFFLFALSAAFVWSRIPPAQKVGAFPRALAFLGQHSLQVFAWSVLLTYVSLALMPASPTLLWQLMDILAVVSSLVVPAKLHSLYQRHSRGAVRLTPRSPQE
jgi:hypothetical protein